MAWKAEHAKGVDRVLTFYRISRRLSTGLGWEVRTSALGFARSSDGIVKGVVIRGRGRRYESNASSTTKSGS